MKTNRIVEVAVKVVVAALTAFLTAITGLTAENQRMDWQTFKAASPSFCIFNSEFGLYLKLNS